MKLCWEVTMNEMNLHATIDALKQQLKTLSAENAMLRYERDCARAQTMALLPTATPEQEQEYVRLKTSGVAGGLAELITELEKSPS
jgi:regulator of replication initiation timing